MSSFSIPTLSRSDIITIITEYEIASISDSDLINPSAEFICNLYACILAHLGAFQEDDAQINFGALERFDNPDMHVDSVRLLHLFSRMRQLLAAIHCPFNLTLEDFVRPDTNRNVKFLSALLNFLLHKDSRLNLIQPYVDELTKLDELRKEREARISELNAEIAQYGEAKEREKPIVNELEAKLKDLRKTITDLNTHQSNLRKDHRIMRERAQEMDEKISRAEFELVQSAEENANLRSKIVQSPEKLQSALEEKKAVQMEAKNSERLAMQTFEEKTALLEVYMKAWKKMTKHFAQMQATQEQANSAKSVEKDVKLLKAKLSDDQVLEMSLESRVLERQGKADELDDYKRQLETERDVKCEDGRRDLDEVKLKVESRRCDLEARGKTIEAMLGEVDVATSKINSVKDSATATQEELMRRFEEVVNEFQQYSNAIGSVLSNTDGQRTESLVSVNMH